MGRQASVGTLATPNTAAAPRRTASFGNAPVQSGATSPSSLPAPGLAQTVSTGTAPAPSQRLSAASGPAAAAGRSGYWNIAPGVQVPSVTVPSSRKRSGGLASLVTARPAVPGPTISSGAQCGLYTGCSSLCMFWWVMSASQQHNYMLSMAVAVLSTTLNKFAALVCCCHANSRSSIHYLADLATLILFVI